MRNSIKVLIVDDDKASGAMLSEVVKRMGHKPILANKPSDALNIVRLQTVHAAIVDVLLPKMTGVELVHEIRKTKFAEGPVVFVSGVFKDKKFATEALKATAATDFLFKPFAADDLINCLTTALQSVVSSEKWTVQTLLTRKLNSDRERAKAIEHLEQIKGLDFPFVLSILMEVCSTGHLNIVNNLGEIFGVALVQGTISQVDSAESQSTAVLSLISKGYLSQDDWDTTQASENKKFSLEKLVEDGYVSPHAISESRREQIMHDLRSICSSDILQVNFVPQDAADQAPKYAVKLHDLMHLLESSLDEFFPHTYLEEFYSPVRTFPLRAVRDNDEAQKVWNSQSFQGLHVLKETVEDSGTLDQVLSMHPDQEAKIFQGIHFLVLNRAIMFDDLFRTKNLNNMLDRYQKLYADLNNKTADKVFEYFGAGLNSGPKIIQGIFDEYAKFNNPSQLNKDANPELRDLCIKCFAIVSAAKEVLTDEGKRLLLMNQLKNEAAEKQAKSQQLMNVGLEQVRTGQVKEALNTLRQAEDLFTSRRLQFIRIWAEVKAEAHADKPRLQEILKTLSSPSAEDKKSAYYYMATGLVKKHLGDSTAPAMFEKALQMDSQFSEARRELNAPVITSKTSGGNKKLDIFTGDITAVVSQIFRRKVD